MKRPTVFLSYAREDAKEVSEIFILLQQSGYVPWMDTEDIFGGEDWEQKINSVLKDSDFYLVFMSEISTLKKGFFQKEIELAVNYNNENAQDKIFLIPVFLEDCKMPEMLIRFNKIDLFKASGRRKLIQTLAEGVKKTGSIPPILLRKEPSNSLTEAEAIDSIKRLNLFDKTRNPKGTGLPEQYEIDIAVISNPVTGLMWQTSGTIEQIPFTGAVNPFVYIKILNTENWKGYNDWRLPTLEEAMSLMKEKNSKTGLYVPFIFDGHQKAIATCDTFSYEWGLGTFFWIALFTQGDCQCLPANDLGKCWVRAVRSLW